MIAHILEQTRQELYNLAFEEYFSSIKDDLRIV